MLQITTDGKAYPLASQQRVDNHELRISDVEADIDDLKRRVAEILSSTPAPPIEPKPIEPGPPIELPPANPPQREGITIGPDDNTQEAVNDANGQQIWLKDGDYEPIMVRGRTRIKAINPHKARIKGTIDWGDGWTKNGEVWFKPLSYTFHQHEAKRVHGADEHGNGASPRGLAHRAAMQPHMLVWDGKPMQPVYSAGTLNAGEFFLEGTSESPKGLWAKFSDTPTPGRVELGISQYLVKTITDDTDGVEIDGLVLQYCANTGVHGAIHMPTKSDFWKLTNLMVLDSMSEGIRLRGNNHLVQSCFFNRHGHVGIAAERLYKTQVIDCEASHNVWRYGVDPLWHAGGFKGQYGVNECLFKDYTAVNNNGAGFWLDIHNYATVLDGFHIDNNSTFGVHIEHHSQNGVVANGMIRGTRKFWNEAHNRWEGSGLQIQGSVTGYTFENLQIHGNADGAVYYKKQREPRGDSGNNEFINIRYASNGNNNRWAIQGDIDAMPDSYNGMEIPKFANW